MTEKSIATYPQWTQLTLKDIDEISTYWMRSLHYSGLVGSNLFLTDVEGTTKLTRYSDEIILIEFCDVFSGSKQYSMIGPGDSFMMPAELQNESWIYLPEGQLPDSDNYDYIYTSEQLKRLHGPEYAGIRRKLSLFKRDVLESVFRQATSSDHDVIWKLASEWFESYREGRTEQEVFSAELELRALEKGMLFINQLGLRLHVLENQDNKVIGFIVTEELPNDTELIHFIKTQADIPGVAEMVMVEFAKTTTSSSINFQQDLGLSGLRQFKQSLQPDRLIEVFMTSSD